MCKQLISLAQRDGSSHLPPFVWQLLLISNYERAQSAGFEVTMWTNLISEAMRAKQWRKHEPQKQREMKSWRSWWGLSQNNIDLRRSNVKTTAPLVINRKFSRNFARHLSRSFKLASLTTAFKGADEPSAFVVPFTCKLGPCDIKSYPTQVQFLLSKRYPL